LAAKSAEVLIPAAVQVTAAMGECLGCRFCSKKAKPVDSNNITACCILKNSTTFFALHLTAKAHHLSLL
jgi:hypothetical protein